MANPQRSFCLPFLLLFAGAVFRIVDWLAHRGRLADVGLPVLYSVFLFLMLWRFLSPPGSAARQWARFGILVFFSSMLLDMAWIGVGPPALTPAAAVVWGMVAFGVLFLLHCFVSY